MNSMDQDTQNIAQMMTGSEDKSSTQDDAPQGRIPDDYAREEAVANFFSATKFSDGTQASNQDHEAEAVEEDAARDQGSEDIEAASDGAEPDLDSESAASAAYASVTQAETDEPAEEPVRERTEPEGERKPRICLMGEFSAGKSTLTNFLIGGSALPVNITATQLPPVWISYGDETPYRVDLDGGEYDVDLNNLTDVSVDDTSHIRIFSRSDLLQSCDIIDMPGISDPNMAPEVWQRVVHHADAIIWCSHATQAWRQSEAAVWSMMTPSLYEKSILLLTRIDKIVSDRDRERVVRRVGRETNGLFREIFPVSLLKAVEANGNEDMIAESGAAAFKDALDQLLKELNGENDKMSTEEAHDAILQTASEGPVENVTPRRIRPRKLTARKLTRRTALAPPSEDSATL